MYLSWYWLWHTYMFSI